MLVREQCSPNTFGTPKPDADTFRDVVLRALWKLRLIILARAVASLVQLHSVGLPHGNFRGETILVDGCNGLCGLDCGVEDANGTDAQVLACMVPWAAPERVGRHNVGATFAGDVYSVGMVLVEALTGAVPFGDATPLALLLEWTRCGRLPQMTPNFVVTDRERGSVASAQQLARHCLSYDAKDRPTIVEVHQRLAALAAECLAGLEGGSDCGMSAQRLGDLGVFQRTTNVNDEDPSPTSPL